MTNTPPANSTAPQPSPRRGNGKRRLDLLLVERGLAESRERARRLIMAGQVLVDEVVVDKPGKNVPADATLRVRGSLPYVSRGGLKLKAALDEFGLSVAGLTAVDVGASTGGFTDCLLQEGAALAALWLLVDVAVTLQYHQALARSGGLADHSDASYHLAYYLQYNGLGAPIALDWGMDATVRFLSQGTVRPIEIFGYERLDGPDAGFVQRLEPFLQNRDNVYLLHAPGQTVFQGRREAWMAEAAARGLQPVLLADFRQRDGTPVYELWRVVAP